MSGFERLTELGIRAASMEPRVDGTPLRGLGWLEIAAAMASVPSEGSDLLRAAYLCDRHALARTLKRLAVRVSGRAGVSADMAGALALTAMQAFMAMRTCGTCDGSGLIGGDACPSCGGAKVDHLPASALRTMLQVSEPVWEAILAEPFGELYRELLSWHETGKRVLERKVRR